MINNNERPIGKGTGFTIRPSAAVRNFAADTIEYSLFAQDQLIMRIPIIDESAVNAANDMGGVTSLIRCGSSSERTLASIEDYGFVINGLKEKKIDPKTYVEYQQKILFKIRDIDYLMLLRDKDLAEDEERTYRGNKRLEFVNKLPKEFFNNLILSGASYDVHPDSALFEKELRRVDGEAKDRISKGEYDQYISSIDKMVGSVIDMRQTKPKIPVVLFMTTDANPEVSEILFKGIEKGTLQTRENWNNSVWAPTMDALRDLLQENHDYEAGRVREEINQGLYGKIDIKKLDATVVQKLGLDQTL